jgi:phenylalanyl-tRNA synthetase alpha chain
MNIQQLKEEAIEKINSTTNITELTNLKVFYLGKKGHINSLMSHLGSLKVEEKASFGKDVNELKTLIINLIEEKQKEIELKDLKERLSKDKIDVTLPEENHYSANKHILTSTIDYIVNIALGLGFSVVEGFEVEEDEYNFELLNIPKEHPARDMQDTFYISETKLLRTHTSPVQARFMLSQKEKKPLKIVCPGKVFRRDDDDATHSHQFTQIEGLVVDSKTSMADLYETLKIIVQSLFGKDRDIRFRSSYFPFTEPSVEVDVSCSSCHGQGCSVCKGTGYIEILGAGMVHPNVLANCGFNPQIYQGFAFGLGIERIAMLRYGIPDIRHFYNNDIRVLKQFKRGN